MDPAKKRRQCHFTGGNQLFVYTRFNEIRVAWDVRLLPVCVTITLQRSIRLVVCVGDFHRNITAPPGGSVLPTIVMTDRF